MTYLSALHSGTLSVGVTETDGQLDGVSVRWTQQRRMQQKSKVKQIISS